MDRMNELKGKGLLTRVKNGFVPKVQDILGSVVPGYDYRAKEQRANTDRCVRERLAKELEKSYATLEEIGALAHSDERRDVLTHIKDAQQSLDLLKRKIENAAYGLSPFFRQEKLENANLVRLIEFDAKMLDELAILTETTDLMYDNILEGKSSDFVLQVRMLKRSVDHISNSFKDRENFLMNLA